MSGNTAPGLYQPGYARVHRRAEGALEAAAAHAPPQRAVLLPEHRDALDSTLSHTVACLPDYRNRIMKFVRWWSEKYPAYAELVVFDLSAEQRENRREYHTSTHDLHYQKLDPKMTQAYISAY